MTRRSRSVDRRFGRRGLLKQRQFELPIQLVSSSRRLVEDFVYEHYGTQCVVRRR